MGVFIFPSFHFGRKALRRKGLRWKESGKIAVSVLSASGRVALNRGGVLGRVGVGRVGLGRLGVSPDIM